jgi:hypothetical protein
MLLLGDEAQVDARFGLVGDSANIDARLVHGLRRTNHRLRKIVLDALDVTPRRRGSSGSLFWSVWT